MGLLDVFNKVNEGSGTIEYETFKIIGWTPNDYFMYMSFCDEIRSAAIMTHFIVSAKGIKLLNGRELRESIVMQRINALFKWLQHFSDEKLQEPSIYMARWLIDNTVYGHKAHYSFWHPPKKAPEPSLIYVSSFDFTALIETLISRTLRDLPVVEFEEPDRAEDLSTDEINKRIRDIKFEIDHYEEPDFPGKMDSYVRIIWWARKQTEYERVQMRLLELKTYEEELEKRKTPVFTQKTSTIYIYIRDNIICKKNNHQLEEVNCEINLPEGEGMVSAQYCHTCHKFIISETSYNTYRQRYSFLPIRFLYVNSDGSFPSAVYLGRAEQSPLKLAGYSVSKKDGLQDNERQKILRFLIQNQILRKSDIRSYLELFINTNGAKRNMHVAVSKWERDLQFINDFGMSEQKTYWVNEIKEY